MHLLNRCIQRSSLKPNWWFGIKALLASIGFNRIRKSFSKTFEKTGSRLIGLYDVAFSRGLPGFGNRMISASFHCFGKCERLNTALSS